MAEYTREDFAKKLAEIDSRLVTHLEYTLLAGSLTADAVRAALRMAAEPGTVAEGLSKEPTAYSDRELLELFRMLLRAQIREERINSIEELHGLLRHVTAALAASPSPPAPAPSWTAEDERRAVTKSIKRRIKAAKGSMPRTPELRQGHYLNRVVDELKTLLAEIKALPQSGGSKPEPSGWQPIETAPKDGTRVIIARRYPPWGWVRGVGYWADMRGIRGWIALCGASEPPGVLGLGHPELWRPFPDMSDLPPPPASPEKEASPTRSGRGCQWELSTSLAA